MTTSRLPFRNYLKRRSKRGRSKSEWYRDLQRLLAREYREDEAFLMKIINHEDELLPWLLIEQEKATWRHLDPDAPGSSVIQHLMERATKDLSNEPGIWWTPLIDALADLGAWNRTGYRLKSIPDDLELRRPIRIWLKKASPAGLDQWLVFKSFAARKDAIEYSATLTWKQLDELTNDPALVKELSRDWELCEQHWRRLVEKGWRIYQEQAQNRDDLRAHHIQMTWLSLFHGFTLTQHKLPAHIRRGLVEEAENSEKTNQHASEPKRNLIVALLADDQGLTKREFKRLMALDPEKDAIVPMLRCRWSTYDDHVRILTHNTSVGDTAWKIFLSRNPGLDPRWLSHILNVEPHQPLTLLVAIATHPAANETVWLELVEKKGAPLVGSILIGHDKALKSKKIRDLLREVDRSGAYALKVLEEVEDEQEWLETFRCLVARNPEKAARALASENIPENVELTAKDMAPLLQSAQGHVRMTAICALEKLRISIEDSGIRNTDGPSHTDTRTMS